MAEESVSNSTDDEDTGDGEPDRPKRKKRAKKTDKSLLVREIVRHELPEDRRVCPVTGVLLVPIGEEVTEELHYVAAELQILEHHRVF